MPTSIQYPTDRTPSRNSARTPNLPITSRTESGYDTDQHMRMFMAETTRSGGSSAGATTRSAPAGGVHHGHGRIPQGRHWTSTPQPQHQRTMQVPGLRHLRENPETLVVPRQRSQRPPPTEDYLRPTRQAGPPPRADPAPPPQRRNEGLKRDSGRSEKEQRPAPSKAKKPEKSNVLEDYLGIYRAENKLPPGRSAADDFAATIAKKLQFGRKNSVQQENEEKDSKEVPCRREEQPPQHIKTSQGFMAELPGSLPEDLPMPLDIPEPPRSSVTRELRNDHCQAHSSQSGSRKGGSVYLQHPRPLNTEGVYAQMPLPAVPPSSRPTTSETLTSKYGGEIADWAEDFFQDSQLHSSPPPLLPPPPVTSSPASRSSSFSRPHSRASSSSHSTMRSSSIRSTPSLSSSRTSYASSTGDRYEAHDVPEGLGLGVIGEEKIPGKPEGLYRQPELRDAEEELYLPMASLEISGYYEDYHRKQQQSRSLPLQADIRRASTISTGSTGSSGSMGSASKKCGLDYEIEAYLAERRRIQAQEAATAGKGV
ncbi:hypothetical protein FN846DRAFT_205566 [Sphaerosporella brunnea]|uniref:Uncharacterized protein n=1 Tax=Sphaerosporella brunnea TaxID=1250544 RepID=A0A5J5ENF0_9PEZI|nr:hypothetical protein FN846DRAFT_205566 [Sphaerosporella brunnea]